MKKAEEREAQAATSRIGIGLISLGGRSPEVVGACRIWLERYLSSTFPAFEWQIAEEHWEQPRAEPLWLMDRARENMEKAGWQFSFLVGEKSEYASADGSVTTLSFSHSAALIRLPAAIPDGDASRGGDTAGWCCRLILACFARLNGLPYMEEMEVEGRDLEEEGDPLKPEDKKALEGALHSLADNALKRGMKEIKGLTLYVRIFLSHPMRVFRSVLSHRPLRIVFSLGKLVFAAMAALVIALLSAELWYLGMGMNAWRLVLIAVAVQMAATVYVVFRQRLFVRRVSRSLSEQAAFFNLTSFLTVFSVLLTLFAIIFIVTILVTLGAYPRYIVEDWVMRSEVGFFDYVRVSLLISSMAMVVGALGAGLEENQHFRQVMYADRNR